jgi:2-oxo-4-hydroxy-4-carboxy-5-ureidoimidazoline decarboxylase
MSATPALTLAQFNALDHAGFLARVGAVYEHSPWVAEEAWGTRPFTSVEALHAAMQNAVACSACERQIELIRAHPELLGKLAAAELTEASRGEQASAGLDRCTAEQRARLQALNQAYREKFGFPFVVAVRGLNWGDIIARLTARLAHERGQEVGIAIGEIGRIAGFRLGDIIAG